MKLVTGIETSPLSPRTLSLARGHNNTLPAANSQKKKYFPQVDFQLVMRPRQPGMEWQQFLYNGGINEKYRLALDGYVNAATVFDYENLVGNVDHHCNCDRLGTRATAGQIWMRIRAGLYNVFKNQYGPKVTAYVNGHDEDDAFATLLLEEPNLIVDDTHGHLRKLVWDCDELDATAGMCPINFDDPNYKKIFWITEPYRNTRNDFGMIHRADPGEHVKVLREIQQRVKHYLKSPDNCPQIDGDVNYDVISQEEGWVMIEEIGNQARLGALADGHTVVMSHKHMGQDQDGKDLHRYILAMTEADYHPHLPQFNKIADRLNQIEQRPQEDQWGGNSNIVIGSPRKSFSKIPPHEMTGHIRELIKEGTSRQSSDRHSMIVPSVPHSETVISPTYQQVTPIGINARQVGGQ